MNRDGFTLVEMLIVMLVMALLATAVVLTAGGGGRSAGADASRLASRIAAAQETAITSGRPVAVWISRSGYGFDVRSGGKWRPVDQKPFETIDWPAGTAIVATGMPGRQALLSGGRARLVFDNLGFPDSPIQLDVSRDGSSAQIDVLPNGDVKVQ
ncbi:MAG TPA: GspH/FimT family pseudopilin [Sphingomicrobium sp.]|nr:GspH/FimT family pseudopilin [Sphingomicrobium sp.]